MAGISHHCTVNTKRVYKIDRIIIDTILQLITCTLYNMYNVPYVILISRLEFDPNYEIKRSSCVQCNLVCRTL